MKTPLITVGGLTRLVQKHLEEDDPDRARLGFIIREAERLEYMVKKMLDFSRPLELDQSNERVEQMIGECLLIVAGIAQEKEVTIETQFSNDLPMITVDVIRMKQAFVNLLTNAIQASPEGESVTVRASQEKGNIIVDVVDCGPGISPDKTGVVFHPFFTTRAEGTGLGLPIAKRIVEAHDGFLRVLGSYQKGTTLRTALPHRNGKGRRNTRST
jgi:two-component system sensor histidine kinase HydH